jgi:hypothetical protein
MLALAVGGAMVAPGQAHADAIVCTGSHGIATTCLTVKGTADTVNWVDVGHAEGTWPYAICDWAAGVWYTPASTGVEVFYSSNIHQRCESIWTVTVTQRFNFNGMRMRNPSYVSGMFYHDGNWAPGRPAAVVSRA